MHKHTQRIHLIKNAIFVLAEPWKAAIILTSKIFQRSVLKSNVDIFLYFIRTRLSIYILREKCICQKNIFSARMRMCPANKNSCGLLLLISNQKFLDSSTILPLANESNPWKCFYGGIPFPDQLKKNLLKRGLLYLVWWSILLMNFAITTAVMFDAIWQAGAQSAQPMIWEK